ncbi:hypothetical protein ES706_02995 [subsurface metagenome]
MTVIFASPQVAEQGKQAIPTSIDEASSLLYDASNCWQGRISTVAWNRGQRIPLSTDRRSRHGTVTG